MKILHTSDWHIGRTLYGHKRYEEFSRFFPWLAETIRREAVDVLLVAGDVFDTTTPSNRAQELYYDFLVSLKETTCRHVVITGGNHDSPSFLEAPRGILRALHIHVIGAAATDPGEEVLTLTGPDGRPELMVCAVPYLRERDIRLSEAGESIEDKERRMMDGIRAHYDAVFAEADRQRKALGDSLPMIAMGHLFTAGGLTAEDDGVRGLYVGSLAQIDAGMFPSAADYVALGHLHVPQRVQDAELRRYSGSPLPMGFGEAGQAKSVVLVEMDGRQASAHLLPIPVFQQLERIRGDWETIRARLGKLAAAKSSAWLEVDYDGEAAAGSLREQLDEAIAGTSIEILRVRNQRIIERTLQRQGPDETLDDLAHSAVFERCMEAHNLPDDQRAVLRLAYMEAFQSLDEADTLAR